MIEWQALQALAENEPFGLFGLSGQTTTIIRTAHSILYGLYNWKGEGSELTSEEIDEIKAALDALFKEVSIPMLIGALFPYPGLNVPEGSLPCDGNEYAKIDYPELYEYLTGSDLIVDEETFITPFFPGQVVSMADEDHEPGDDFGEVSHTMTEGELVPHSHSESVVGTTVGTTGEIPALPPAGASGTTGTTGGGEPFPLYQPTRAYNWAIVSGRQYTASPSLIEATIFGFDTPSFGFGIDDSTPVMLGLRFRSSIEMTITHIKTWRRSDDGTGRIGYLWENDGTLLSSGDFGDELTTGWITAELDAPITIEPDTTYVCGAFFANGHFITTPSGMTVDIDNFPLTALADGLDGDNCVYAYASAGTFPTNTFLSSLYWLDVIGEY